MIFVVAWMLILLAILTVEALAILNTKRSDTLSEQIWWLRTKWWGRIVLFPLWAWLSYHFFLEPETVAIHVWIDDFILIAITLIATALFGIIKEPKQEEDLRALDRDGGE